jgi:hypothetical protein
MFASEGDSVNVGRLGSTAHADRWDGGGSTPVGDQATGWMARRLQGRLDRQQWLLDRHLSGEQSLLPELLEIGRRMRRDTEVLQMLAGDEPGPRPTSPRRLADTVTDAVSGSEEPSRVAVRSAPAASIAPAASVELEHVLSAAIDHVTIVYPDARVDLATRVENLGGVTVDIAVDGALRPEPDNPDGWCTQTVVEQLGRRSRHGVELRRPPGGAPTVGSGLVLSVHCPPGAVTVDEPVWPSTSSTGGFRARGNGFPGVGSPGVGSGAGSVGSTGGFPAANGSNGYRSGYYADERPAPGSDSGSFYTGGQRPGEATGPGRAAAYGGSYSNGNSYDTGTSYDTGYDTGGGYDEGGYDKTGYDKSGYDDRASTSGSYRSYDPLSDPLPAPRRAEDTYRGYPDTGYSDAAYSDPGYGSYDTGSTPRPSSTGTNRAHPGNGYETNGNGYATNGSGYGSPGAGNGSPAGWGGDDTGYGGANGYADPNRAGHGVGNGAGNGGNGNGNGNGYADPPSGYGDPFGSPTSLTGPSMPAYQPSRSSGVDELFGPLLDLPIEPMDDRFATPIFEAIASVWFRDDEPAGNEPDWETPNDAEWRAASERAASEPQPESMTSTGLPRRRPGGQLVPPPLSGRPVPVAGPAERVPDRVRDRLSTYQRGLRQGRHRNPEEHSEYGDW